jgi:hypothetical protein
MSTETTELQAAIEESVRNAKRKTAVKKTKAMSDPAPAAAVPAMPTVPATVSDPAPVSYDSRADELWAIKREIKQLEAKARPIEALLRELAKSGPVEGELAIARMQTGTVKGIETSWFSIGAKKPATK